VRHRGPSALSRNGILGDHVAEALREMVFSDQALPEAPIDGEECGQEHEAEVDVYEQKEVDRWGASIAGRDRTFSFRGNTGWSS